MPGTGPGLCIWTHPRSGRPCTKHDIDGLEHCLWHMPDDLLDEAEEITGVRRCRHQFGAPDACHALAVTGTSPPACKNHGANAGSATRKNAAGRVVEGRITDRLVEIMGEHGEALLQPAPVGNPLAELLDLAAEMAAWKNVLRSIVAYLASRERIRFAHDRVGEQLRAEVILYERSLERLAKILIDIAKLNIVSQLAKIEETQVAQVDRALTAALTASGLDLTAQHKARQVLRRELVKAAS